MASLLLKIGSEDRLSRLQRVSSVGVTDDSSLTGISFVLCVCYSVAVGVECLLIFTGTDCSGVLVLVGIIPSMVQEGIVIVIRIRGRRGCFTGTLLLAVLGRKNSSCLA